MGSNEYKNIAEYVKGKAALVNLIPELSEEDFEDLIKKSNFRHFPAGSVICREGDYGDTAFAILEGSVEISIKTEGHDNLTLSFLEEGNVFGEMAALSGYPRNATVTAKDDSYVLEISDEVLKNLMENAPGFKETIDSLYTKRAVRNYIRKVPMFADLKDSTLEQLENIVNFIAYNQGDIIFAEGDIGDSLYIIRTGFVKVSKKHGAKDQIIAYIAHGNYFGEMAILEDEKRNATVSAFTKTEVIQILKDDFNMLLNIDSTLSEKIKDVVIERKLNTLEVQRDPSRAERLETIVEKGLIQAESLLIIDLKSCIQCNNCVESCEDRHGYPRLDRRGTRIAEISIPVACRLCHDPLCLICNFDAIKRAPSGEVHIIDDKCIGVSGCAVRCPYNVIKMVSTKPRRESKWFDILGALVGNREVVGARGKDSNDRKVRPKRLAIKCDNCMGYPDTACTNNCPTHAIRWINPMEYFTDREEIISKKKRYL